jgi:hypothetical protein
MKLFVVLLIVLALLFAVGVGLGARGGDGGKVDPRDHGWVERLFKPFGARTGIDPSALSGPCVSGRSLIVTSGLCRLQAPTGKRVRTLNLALRQGARAVLDFEPAGGPSLPVRQRLKPGDEVHLTIPAEGGSLSVACLDAGGSCVLASP